MIQKISYYSWFSTCGHNSARNASFYLSVDFDLDKPCETVNTRIYVFIFDRFQKYDITESDELMKFSAWSAKSYSAILFKCKNQHTYIYM